MVLRPKRNADKKKLPERSSRSYFARLWFVPFQSIRACCVFFFFFFNQCSPPSPCRRLCGQGRARDRIVPPCDSPRRTPLPPREDGDVRPASRILPVCSTYLREKRRRDHRRGARRAERASRLHNYGSLQRPAWTPKRTRRMVGSIPMLYGCCIYVYGFGLYNFWASPPGPRPREAERVCRSEEECARTRKETKRDETSWVRGPGLTDHPPSPPANHQPRHTNHQSVRVRKVGAQEQASV